MVKVEANIVGICVDDFKEVVIFIFNIIDGPMGVDMLCVHLRWGGKMFVTMEGKVCLLVEYGELKQCWNKLNHHKEANEKGRSERWKRH